MIKAKLFIFSLILLCACQKTRKPVLSIKVEKQNSLNSVINKMTFGMEFLPFNSVMSQSSELNMLATNPTSINSFNCVGLLLGYPYNTNRGNCTTKNTTRVFGVDKMAGLSSFVSAQEVVFNFDDILMDEIVELNLVGFQKPAAAASCAILNPSFSPDDLNYSNGYVLAQSSFNTRESQDLTLTASFIDSTITDYVDDCDATLFDEDQNNVSLLNGIAGYFPMEDKVGAGVPYDIKNLEGSNANDNLNSSDVTVNASGGVLSGKGYLDYSAGGHTGPNTKTNSQFNPTSGSAITYSIWLKAASPSHSTSVPVIRKTTASDGFVFGFNSSSYPTFCEVNGSTQTPFSSCTFPSDSSWNHFVLIIDSRSSPTKVKVYQNGSSCGEENLTNGAPSAASSLYMGSADTTCNQMNSGEYNGGFNQFGVWNRALNENEISALYNSGSGLSHSNFTY